MAALRAFSRLSRTAATPGSRLQTARRGLLTLKEAKYETSATADAGGRNGTVKLNDAPPLTFNLATPKGLGGNGKGQNPEQLFAMGYSACFQGALGLVARQQGKKVPENTTVEVRVKLGPPNEKEGFALAVRIVVSGVEDKALVEAAHAACPYSRAIEGNIKADLQIK